MSDAPDPEVLRRTFDTVAARYERARPQYPDEVFALLAERCGLGPGARVLEIGPGPGLATLPILARGASVVAVELGPELGRRLRERTVGEPIEVVVGAFETAVLPADPFDLAVSATAFHWIEPVAGVAKVRDALRPGGWFAPFWNVYGDPTRPDPFHDAIEPVFEAVPGHERSPSTPFPPGNPLDAEVHLSRLRDAGFVDVEHHAIRWTGRHTAAEIRDLFGTFSNVISLADADREELLDQIEGIASARFGGVVERPYVTAIYLGRRP